MMNMINIIKKFKNKEIQLIEKIQDEMFKVDLPPFPIKIDEYDLIDDKPIIEILCKYCDGIIENKIMCSNKQCKESHQKNINKVLYEIADSLNKNTKDYFVYPTNNGLQFINKLECNRCPRCDCILFDGDKTICAPCGLKN